VAGKRLYNNDRVCGCGRVRVGRGAPDARERRVTAHEGRAPLFTELPLIRLLGKWKVSKHKKEPGLN
jgi:hypothetical protein